MKETTPFFQVRKLLWNWAPAKVPAFFKIFILDFVLSPFLQQGIQFRHHHIHAPV